MLKLKWTDNGGEWMSETITGEIAPARIKVSSKNSDGTYSYFCYRNAKALAVVKSLEDAKTRCEKGGDPATDSVLEYVKNNPGELPPFLALSEEERKAIRAAYPHAAPAAKAVAKAVDRGVTPLAAATTCKLAEADDKVKAKAALKAPAPSPDDSEERVSFPPDAVITKLKDGNPKKPGTNRHFRWDMLMMFTGKTVSEYLAVKGSRTSSIHDALELGYIKLEGGK